jgi:hypothetical protein
VAATHVLREKLAAYFNRAWPHQRPDGTLVLRPSQVFERGLPPGAGGG